MGLGPRVLTKNDMVSFRLSGFSLRSSPFEELLLPLRLALDSEWGEQPLPSVVQLAVRDSTWVVDACAVPGELGGLLQWLLETAEAGSCGAM